MTQNWFVTLITFCLGFIAGSIGLFLFMFHGWKKYQSQKVSGVAQVEVQGVFDSEGHEIPKGSPLYNEIVGNITRTMTGAGKPPENKPEE